MWIKSVEGWLFETATKSFARFTLIGAYVYFLMILNRWMFTDLGVESYGRVWQFYVSYGDLGFVRRAFIGTILTVTKVNSLIRNEYAFAYALWAILGLILIVIIFRLIKDVKLSRATVISIAFSPSLLAHFGYSTGSLDIILFILLCIAVLNLQHLSILLLVITMGILSHELFLFYVPFLLALILGTKNVKPTKKDLRAPICILAFSVLVLFALHLFSVPAVSESQYVSMMAAKIPKAAYKHPLWSGYFELYASVSTNMADTKKFSRGELTQSGLLSLIPFAYAILIAFYCLKTLGHGSLLKTALGFGLLAPFFASFLAADFLRWVCMSANCGLLALIVFARRERMSIGDRFSMALFAFCVFSPFGAARLDWPFPLHQFILEKLLHVIKPYR